MRTEAHGRLVLSFLAFAVAVSAGAAEEPGGDRIEALEERVAELEAAKAQEPDPGPVTDRWWDDWTRRVRLGGSASLGYLHREQLTSGDSDAFQVWDARFFVDAELGRDLMAGDTTLVRTVGVTFEWDLVRLGSLRNDVGELYVDFQGLGGNGWLNTQVGRFQIPVGENYLRFSKGYRDNPFISNTVGGPWWWDEGLRFYGSGADGRLGYVASLSNGDTRFNADSSSDPQGTLKLFTDPWPWLHLSVSGLMAGQTGRTTQGAPGALWLGETWAMPIGAMTAVPTYIDGVASADGPTKLDRNWLVGADVVLRPLDGLRAWLAGGRYEIEASGSGPFDRTLYYWIAELVADGRLVSPVLDPLYLALRANALTTGDGGRGYLLDFRLADTVGHNVRNLAEYSVALGLDVLEGVRLRGEYTFQDIDLVRGVPTSISSERDDEHWFAVDVGIAF